MEEASVVVASVVAVPCPAGSVVVVDDASAVGAIEGLASMMTVLVDVAVRPDWSVAT